MKTIILTSADIKDLLDGITLERLGDVAFKIRLDLTPREVRVEEYHRQDEVRYRMNGHVPVQVELTQDAPEDDQVPPQPEMNADAVATAFQGETCPSCGRSFKYEKSYHKHVDKCTGGQEGIPPPSTSAGAAHHHEPLAPGSTCCRAPVEEGEQHDLGNRYCTKCGEPCQWTASGVLPAGANKSFTCRGREDCPRLLEYKNGYCRPCWDSLPASKRTPTDEEQDILDEINGGKDSIDSPVS